MKKLIKTLLLISWLCLIYYLSSQTSAVSGDLSSGILRYIGELINRIIAIDIEKFVLDFSLLIRKSAHFFEYFVLFILSYLCFEEYGITNIIIVFVFCVLYASFDEIHQLFVDGRSGQIGDVCIDSLGSFSSLIICYLCKRKWRK